MKELTLIFFTLVVAAGSAFAGPATQKDKPMSIIALPDRRANVVKEYVKLRLPYGIIVSNAYTNSPPSYYIFSRDERKILKTEDVDVFLAELKDLPDGATVDRISKCTVGFYTQYGVKMDEQYRRITALLKRKRFKLVSSLEDDEKHASFCYCETGFTILEKPRESEQDESTVPSKAAPSASSDVR